MGAVNFVDLLLSSWLACKGACLFQTHGVLPVWQCQSHTSVQRPKRSWPGVEELSVFVERWAHKLFFRLSKFQRLLTFVAPFL